MTVSLTYRTDLTSWNVSKERSTSITKRDFFLPSRRSKSEASKRPCSSVNSTICRERNHYWGEFADKTYQFAFFADCTTLEQAVSKAVSEQVSSIGAAMVDAPVSGGTEIVSSYSSLFIH
jgi:hypothetical protein